MSDYGLMGVDWEGRINFQRLREERLEKTRNALNESDADALIILRPEDIRYVIGFRTHLAPVGYYGSHALVLPKDGDPVLFTYDYEYARSTMHWMPKENIRPPRPWRGWEDVAVWAEEVKKVLKHTPKKIGIDIWEIPVENELKKSFNNVEFIDGKEIINKAKIIKTQDEIACLKAAYSITEAGFEAALEILKPGVKENELLAAAWKKFTELGSEWSQCANIVSSGPYTAPYRRFTSDRIIKTGDLVIIDIGASFNGYWGDTTRTYVCGDVYATKEQKMLAQEAYDALYRGIDQSRPGKTTKDIWESLQNEHSMGLNTGHGSGTGPWEPPFIGPGSLKKPLILKENMQFNLEPYAGIVGIGGVRLEQNIIVREGEPDVYSTIPFDSRLIEEVHPLDKTTGRVLKYKYE